MANCYVVTAHKPTTVSNSVAGNFTSPLEKNLILSKNNKLEIYLVTKDGVKPLKEINIYGQVAVMKLFRPPNADKDSLFLLTNRYNAMILQCVGSGENLSIVTKASGNVCDRIGRPSENGILAVIDPEARVIGLRLYDGLFKVIPLDKDHMELRSWNVRMEEPEVQDLDFLHGCAQPTIVLIHQDINGRHVKTHEVSLKDKEFVKSPWKQDNIENEAAMIIPVPDPICGCLIIGQESVLFHNGTHYIAVSPPVIKTKDSTITCYGAVDARGTKFLLGNTAGQLFMLYLELEEKHDKSYMVKEPKVELLGVVSIPETITYLDEGIVFIGSKFGDSQLIKLNVNRDETGSFITVLESYTNLGPIIDMCVVDLEKQGQGQVITCSGSFKDGSLRIIRNGIGIQEHASIDLIGIKGIWVVTVSPDKDIDDTIVLSFVGHTRMLMFNGDEVEETEFPGFISDEQTFYCGNVDKELLLQTTSSRVRLLSTDARKRLSEWRPKTDLMISVVSGNNNQLVCAAGSDLYYLEVVQKEVVLKKHIRMEYDISCLDVSPLDGKTSNYIAVGLWTDISARVLKLPDLDEVINEPLGGEIIPRSILMARFEGIDYLLVALGDGSMFYFHFLANKDKLMDKKKVTLGTQPIILRTFRSLSTANVFACSDRPTVIYSSNHKLVFSNVNLKQVNHMCSINSEIYPESLVLATDSCITIGTIDEIQKLHIRTVPLGESPRRIAYQEKTKTFGILTMRIAPQPSEASSSAAANVCASTLAQNTTSSTLGALMKSSGTNITGEGIPNIELHSLLIVDQNTFEVLHAHHFPSNEFAISVETIRFRDDPNDYYVVGTGLVVPEESEPKIGRILVFLYDEGKLTTIIEKEVKGACYTLAPFNGKLLASVNSTVRLFEWTLEKELRIECSHFNNIIALFLRTKGDFILIGDLMRSMTLLQYKAMEGSFEEIARDYNPNWMTMVEVMDDDTFLGAENHCNLIVCQKDGAASTEEDRQQMQDIGQYHLGDMVNVFRHGSLVMEHAVDASNPTLSGILFGTVNGALGLVAQLPQHLFEFLTHLQSKLAAVIPSIGNIEHSFWRSFNSEIKTEPAEGFIDGDLIEMFLDLPADVMESIADSLKDYPQYLPLTRSIPFEKGEKMPVAVSDIIKLVEDLTRIH